ncbi:MAG: glycosyltransferase family 4 protein [Nitrospina sp.]|nr:glycosyltransferase family 4 protein [Nitrospina sp.]
MKGASRVIVSSQLEARDALRFGVPQDRIRVIPMGIDLPKTASPSAADAPLRLLFAGRIARVRRVESILKAAARLPFDWTLTLAGGEATTSSMTRDGYVDELKQLAAELNIDSKVRWTGPLPHESLMECYRDADLFLYTSQYENFGQPLLEAAAHGLPLISTRVGVANELIEEHRTGFFTDDSPETLARKIEQLAHREIRQQFGYALRQKVAEHFSWETITQQYLELYRDLTGGGGL